ncbi:Extensin-like protein C-terminus [Tropicibacter naphthalenivorans]|uniref:Extensin-like C-terminal domain-containing protein n=1 Tax=Tropicibacter naphthalenivorans TaxID=441103 RepID=A0A0P1GDY4_9RHOB|nr:hypothetical protein TRN7648_02688 [Tropicibacter naphthalenivorans]SMC75808.1 Extensin-like protein C-terminus [Tropicibacter naphthalenivorans]
MRGFLKSAFSSSKTIEGGGLCGDPMLVGDVVGSVPGRISGCGIENAVRLRAIGDVTLSQPATIDCNTAKALKTWVEDAAMPATKRLGDISGLRVAAHYACRTRNNRPGAKISEHGRGKAIDIAAVQFTDGTELSVLRDWGTGKRGKALREMHGEACGTFGTVLGPGSDGYHKDHFHFDTARHGNGAYCRPR